MRGNNSFLTVCLLCGMFPFVVEASVSKDEALSFALSDSEVREGEIVKLEIKRDKENDIPVYKLEFETKYGDFDYAIAVSSGRFVDIDYEVDEDKIRLIKRKKQQISADDARRIIQKKTNVDSLDAIKIKREGDDGRMRYEGYVFANHMKYEFEIDAASGIIIDYTADFRE